MDRVLLAHSVAHISFGQQRDVFFDFLPELTVGLLISEERTKS